MQLDLLRRGIALIRGSTHPTLRVEQTAQRVELRVLADGNRVKVDPVEHMGQPRHAGELTDHDGVELRSTRFGAADDVDAGDVAAQGSVDEVIDVAALQRLRPAGEQAEDVDGDVALPDDGHSRIPSTIGATSEAPVSTSSGWPLSSRVMVPAR